MSSESEEVFADDFKKKPDTDTKSEEEKKIEADHETDKNSEFPPIPNTEPDPTEIPTEAIDDSPPEDKPKGSRKKGILVAVVIGLIVAGVVFGAEQIMDIDLTDNLNPNELDVPTTPIPAEQPKTGSGTEDVSSTSDKVQLEKTKEPTGYFMVKTNSAWYGDYVDFRKLPNKIENEGTMKVSFRCYTDDFQKTSTYFGTFRNVVGNDLQVDVYIRDKLVEFQSTETNTALTLEGSCYQ